jgi:hypothetical protein
MQGRECARCERKVEGGENGKRSAGREVREVVNSGVWWLRIAAETNNLAAAQAGGGGRSAPLTVLNYGTYLLVRSSCSKSFRSPSTA